MKNHKYNFYVTVSEKANILNIIFMRKDEEISLEFNFNFIAAVLMK